jgi:hypothetical protein
MQVTGFLKEMLQYLLGILNVYILEVCAESWSFAECLTTTAVCKDFTFVDGMS